MSFVQKRERVGGGGREGRRRGGVLWNVLYRPANLRHPVGGVPECLLPVFFPAVIFQPFFAVDTSRYFKRNYAETPRSPSSSKASPTSANSQPPNGQKGPPGRPPPPSHPPPKSRRSEKTLLSVLKTLESEPPEGRGSSDNVEVGEEVIGSESKAAPSPATGQVHMVEQNNSQEHPDGM